MTPSTLRTLHSRRILTAPRGRGLSQRVGAGRRGRWVTQSALPGLGRRHESSQLRKRLLYCFN